MCFTGFWTTCGQAVQRRIISNDRPWLHVGRSVTYNAHEDFLWLCPALWPPHQPPNITGTSHTVHNLTRGPVFISMIVDVTKTAWLKLCYKINHREQANEVGVVTPSTWDHNNNTNNDVSSNTEDWILRTLWLSGYSDSFDHSKVCDYSKKKKVNRKELLKIEAGAQHQHSTCWETDRSTESTAQLLRHWIKPNHRFNPRLALFTTFTTFSKPPPPTPPASAQSSLCLVTVSEQIAEKHSCEEDNVLSTGSPANSRCLDKFLI